MLTGPGDYEPGDLNIGFPMLTGPGDYEPEITPESRSPASWSITQHAAAKQ